VTREIFLRYVLSYTPNKHTRAFGIRHSGVQRFLKQKRK
jgi:hypothetical protein